MEIKKDQGIQPENFNETIDQFCSVLMKMPSFCVYLMSSEQEKLKLVESELIKNLFSNLNAKNKFTNDSRLISRFEMYADTLVCKAKNDNYEMQVFEQKYNCSVDDVIIKPPDISTQGLELEEMTNRVFLKQFIGLTVTKNKLFCAMPEWKRICLFLCGFVVGVLGISGIVKGISERSISMCFWAILYMFILASFICSLIFHWPLFVLIVSSIITGIATIVFLVVDTLLYVSIHKIRQRSGKDIDTFFNLVDKINRYLDTSDLPPKETSFNQKGIFNDSSIDNKIKDVETKEDKKKKSNLNPNIEGNDYIKE